MGFEQLGFIGLGVMGEPICRNLAQKSGCRVVAHDLDPQPLQRLADAKVRAANDVADAVRGSDVVFLSLPSGEIVQGLAEAPDGLLAHLAAGQIVVDLGTSPVDLTRALADKAAQRGATWVDAPVARTRAAAQAGTLSVMVGAAPEVYDRLLPLLATFGSDIALCGATGCGQVVKILNNMILFETVVAISEAKAIAAQSGVDPTALFDILSKGSADSFALRNHGMKAVLPDEFPSRAFSVEYARKDLRYALRLAQQAGIDAAGARHVDTLFEQAIQSGLGDLYHPVISRLIARRA